MDEDAEDGLLEGDWLAVSLGDVDSVWVGDEVGDWDGCFVGEEVGGFVGDNVGARDGWALGDKVGFLDGGPIGEDVGDLDGGAVIKTLNVQKDILFALSTAVTWTKVSPIGNSLPLLKVEKMTGLGSQSSKTVATQVAVQRPLHWASTMIIFEPSHVMPLILIEGLDLSPYELLIVTG